MSGQSMINGTIARVNETEYSCTVQPDKDSVPMLENVPLRVHNLQDDFGIIVVPVLDTPCQVAFIENVTDLPVLMRVQAWEKIIVKKEDIFSLVIDNLGNVVCETEGNVAITAKDDIHIKNQSGMEAFVDGKNKRILLNQGKHQIVMTNQGTCVGSPQAKEPLVLGNKLLKYLSQVRVICTAPGQQSSTLVPPPTKALLSDEHFTEK